MTVYHNPENVPESEIPQGCRFLTLEESKNEYMNEVGLWWPEKNKFGKLTYDSIYEQYTYIVKNLLTGE